VRRWWHWLVLWGLLVGPGGAIGAEELPLHGFLQAASAYRLIPATDCPPTQQRACEERFLLGEGRVRLELTPRGDRWALAVRAEAIYDAVSDRADAELREAYLDWTWPALDLRVGRQIITWGVGDLIFITDVFPKDWVAFVSGLPLEYLKKGVDALSATVHAWDTSLQLVVIPRFEPDTVPEAGGRTRFDDSAGSIESRRTDDPPVTLENTQVGLRIFRSVAGWDGSLYGYRGFFLSPAAEVEPGPQLRFFFPPLNVYGASAQGAALGGVVSLEGGYYDSRADGSGGDPSIENSSVRFLVGYQREVVPDLTVSGQYYVQVMEDHGEFLRTRPPGMPKRPLARHVLTLRLTQLFLHQTLRLGLFLEASPNEGDCYVNPEGRYQVTDALSVTVGANLFGGPRRTPFGQFAEDSNAYVVLRYAF
jgi:hypothetical protein